MHVEGSYLIMTQGDVTLPLLLNTTCLSLSLKICHDSWPATKSLPYFQETTTTCYNTTTHIPSDIGTLYDIIILCHVYYIMDGELPVRSAHSQGKGSTGTGTRSILHCVGPVHSIVSFTKVFHPRPGVACYINYKLISRSVREVK